MMSDVTTKGRSFWKRRPFLVSLFLIAFVLGLSGLILDGMSREGNEKYEATVSFGEKGAFSVDVADTPLLRMRGLSGRERLPEGRGMLFVFSEPETPSFWMKDMNFAIDIVWLSAHRRIVHIDRDISPETFPKSFIPPEAVLYVLEIPAGTSRERGLAPGDLARIEFP